MFCTMGAIYSNSIYSFFFVKTQENKLHQSPVFVKHGLVGMSKQNFGGDD